MKKGSGDGVTEVTCIHTGTDWVARILPHFNVVAFHGSKLIVKDVKENRGLCDIECGGGHRSWDIIDGERVVYIKDRQIFTQSLEMEGNLDGQSGLHTQQINTVIHLR